MLIKRVGAKHGLMLLNLSARVPKFRLLGPRHHALWYAFRHLRPRPCEAHRQANCFQSALYETKVVQRVRFQLSQLNDEAGCFLEGPHATVHKQMPK